MATGPMQNVLQHLRKALEPRMESGASDAELLERFFAYHDDAAFELLVWRHHRMVLGVCSRLLADSNDVEDAFQATFLVLARKGRSIRKRGSLSSWLFGVARRVALEASRATQRLQPSGLTLPSSCPEPVDELMRQEFHGIVDEELGHLPEKYRAPVVLCYLEGMTYEEAGQHLGCSKGTISTRLTRARELLRTRLAGRGLAVSAGSLAAWLCANAASAGAPSSLVVSTMKAATSLAAGQATGVISTHVAALTEGVLKIMFLSKLKAVVAVVLVLCFFAAGATVLTYRTVTAQNPTPAPPVAKEPEKTPRGPAEEKKGKETFTAWGKEVGGLQAGLGYDAGQKRAYRHGETVRLALRLRNVCKKEVEFLCCRQYFMEKPPTMTDGQGKPVRLPPSAGTPTPRQEKMSLAPGKEIELYELKFKLRPAGENGDEDNDLESLDPAGTGSVFTFFGKGKFQIQYEQLIEKPWAGREPPDPTLSKLVTGKLQLEIKADPPPASEKKEEDKEQPPPGGDNLPASGRLGPVPPPAGGGAGEEKKTPSGGRRDLPASSDAKNEQSAWGKPVNGLRLGLYQTDPKDDGKPRLTVVLENVSTEDLVVILGQSTARGKKHWLSAKGLNLTYADDMLKRPRALVSKGSKRDDLADGPIASPLVVQLVAGGRYMISSDLNDYYDPKDVDALLAPGQYRVAAKFVGQAYLSGWKSKTDTGPRTYLDHMTYWTGTVESEHIQVTQPAKPTK